MKKTEISLAEIIRVLFRRKWIIIFSILLFLIGAIIYNSLTKPLYQSTVLIKKEANIEGNIQQDRIENLVALKTQDELETEMQLVQTRNVLNNLISELSLNVKVKKIEEQDGTVTIIDLPVSEYRNTLNLSEFPSDFPQINVINIGLKTTESGFIISQNQNGVVELLDFESGKSLKDFKKITNLSYDDWILDYSWPNKAGKIYFETIDYNDLFEELNSNIFTSKRIKTNIFEVGVRFNYPYTTKLLANTLADKFRESRVSLQKENIKYTVSFIDERLQEVASKLEAAENELSEFKSTEQIAEIDEQSKQVVEFLSNLENEKLSNDLELGIFNNRLNSIKNEMKQDGFIDQTYLTPEQYQTQSSPFPGLMADLTNLELQKLELLQKRTEVHPDVVILTEQIQRVKAELTKYNKSTVKAYEIMAKSLSNKKKELNSLIAKYSNKLEQLPSQQSDLASLIRNRDSHEKMYTLLLEKREEMRLAELSKMQDITILDPAVEAIKPVSPNKKLNILFAGLLGLIFGFFGVLVAQTNDNKIGDVWDIENNFNFPVLTVIPPYDKETNNLVSTSELVKDRFVTMMDERYKYKEAFRRLETKLVSKIEGKPKKLMLTSCEENAGKTSAASNLAITMAQSGKKVLLVDCDIKNPSISELFGLPKYSSGLIDYLIGKSETPNVYKPVKLTNDSNILINLDILPTGEFSNISGEVLSSEKMRKLISNLEYYDFIIFDTPPITRLSDAISLGRIIKDTLLVVRPGQTVKESIDWAVAELKTSETNFHGVIVNDCKVSRDNFKYQYGYERH